MKRWLGIGALLVSVLIMFAGWATWSGMGEEASTLNSMRVVTAAGLAKAQVGDRVVVEGTAVAPANGLVAPVSHDDVAWYEVRRQHHWQELAQTCSKHHICHNYWKSRSEHADGGSSKTLSINAKGGSALVSVTRPREFLAVARLYKRDSATTDMHVQATDKRRDDELVTDEYSIKPGAVISLAGMVTGSGAARTLTRVPTTSLVYQASRDSMVKNIRGYEQVGVIMMLVALLVAIAGIVLIVRDARARRVRRALAPAIPGVMPVTPR